MRFGNIETKQAEDNEWLKSLAHRVNNLEQQNGLKAYDQNTDEKYK